MCITVTYMDFAVCILVFFVRNNREQQEDVDEFE